MAHEYPRYWFMSNPRSSDGSWEKWREHYEQEYPHAGVDLAKPGSDQTVVGVYPTNRQMRDVILKSNMKEEYDRLKRKMEEIALCPPSILVTKEEAARAIPSCPIAEAAFPKQSEPDRIWDLIVLAARSSRYG